MGAESRSARVPALMAPVVEVTDLVKRYGDFTAVRSVSFSVEEGEIFGILGPNGSGKTTTVESLQGLRDIDGGRASILGLDPVSQSREIRRRIGSQLQDSSLPDRMKVWEALDLFRATGPHGSTTDQVLADWGLSAKKNARFGTLSGGQRQRLFVALALVNNPEVVFLDEMTTGLDPASRRVAWDLIRRIREKGTTVVLVTHFMDEAEALCDRVAFFDRGEVVAEGSIASLIDRFGGGVKVKFTIQCKDGGWLAEIPHVSSWERDRDRFEVRGDGPVLTHVASALMGHGYAPEDLRVERASLEDVFLRITTHSGGME